MKLSRIKRLQIESEGSAFECPVSVIVGIIIVIAFNKGGRAIKNLGDSSR